MKALLIMAHGSPRPEANDDVRRVAAEIAKKTRDTTVEIGYLECNQPDIPTAVDLCISAGAVEIIAVPYFLHSGRHLLRDLPRILEESARRHPGISILMGDYLGHDPIVADVLMDRVREAFG